MNRPDPSDAQLSSIRVSFDNERKVRSYPLTRVDYSDRVLLTTEHDGRPDIFVKHPSGEVIAVSAEVWVGQDSVDVSISVLQKDEIRAAARGASAVLLSYMSLQGNLFFLEVGSGPWE